MDERSERRDARDERAARAGDCRCRIGTRPRGGARRAARPAVGRWSAGRAPRRAARRSRPGPTNLATAQVPVRRRPGRRVGVAVPGHRRRRLRDLLADRLLRRHHAPARRSRCSSRRWSPAGPTAAPDRSARASSAPRSSCSAGSPRWRCCSPSWASRSPPAPPTWRDSVVEGIGRDPGLARGRSAPGERLPDQRLPQRDAAHASPRAPREGGVLTRIGEVGTALGHVVAGFFIVLFSTYFFLADGEPDLGLGGPAGPARRARAKVDSSGRVAWRSLTQFVRATVLVAAVDAIGDHDRRRHPRRPVRAGDRRAGLPRRLRADDRRHASPGRSRCWSRWSTRARSSPC